MAVRIVRKGSLFLPVHEKPQNLADRWEFTGLTTDSMCDYHSHKFRGSPQSNTATSFNHKAASMLLTREPLTFEDSRNLLLFGATGTATVSPVLRGDEDDDGFDEDFGDDDIDDDDDFEDDDELEEDDFDDEDDFEDDDFEDDDDDDFDDDDEEEEFEGEEEEF